MANKSRRSIFVDNKKFIEVGSNPEKALQGDYQLNVVEIFKEAWDLTKVNKQPIISGLFFIVMIGMAFSLVASDYLGGMEEVLANPEKQMIINLVATVILWPFIAGIEMMGISHAVGIKTKTSYVFSFLKRSALIAITALIVTSITSIGFSLFLIPGIYLSVALSLTVPLIVEKGMTPIAAIVLSLKATRFQIFKLLQIYAMLLAILFATLLPGLAGIEPLFSMAIFIGSMVWLAPLYYNVKGVLYREIFGVRMQVVSKSADGKPDTFFSA